MAIRRRVTGSPYKKLLYHRQYGSIINPPLHMGKYWPNGSLVISLQVPGRKNKEIVLGWTCTRGRITKDNLQRVPKGVWVCTKDRSTKKTVNDQVDFEYVGEAEGHEAAARLLKDAYEEKHGTVLI